MFKTLSNFEEHDSQLIDNDHDYLINVKGNITPPLPLPKNQSIITNRYPPIAQYLDAENQHLSLSLHIYIYVYIYIYIY